MTLEEKIQTALDKGLIEGAKRNLRLLLEQEHKAEWTKTKQDEYNAEFVSAQNVIIGQDEEGNNIIETETIDNGIGFDIWINETKTILVDTVIETDDNGVEYTKEIFKDVLIREFIQKESYETEINEYLLNNSTYTKTLKQGALKTLDITTVTSGVQFYTDANSIIDLMIARDEAIEQGATDDDVTNWKTPSGIIEVTLFDIKEAIKLRLTNKAKLVGVE